jgi:hypothetical protein
LTSTEGLRRRTVGGFYGAGERLLAFNAWVDRARQYGIDREIVAAANKLGKENYAMRLLKGYTAGYKSKAGNGYVFIANGAVPNKDEIELAKRAADDGHQIFFTPVNGDTFVKNPDMIMDDNVADIKHVISKNPAKVWKRLETAKDQKVTTVLMQINEEIDPLKIYDKVNEYFLISRINHVIVRYGGIFSIFTNEKAALFFTNPLPKPGEKQNSLMLDNIALFGEKVKSFFQNIKNLQKRRPGSLNLPLSMENTTLYTPPERYY